MSALATKYDRLLYLAELVCDESVSSNEIAELNSILLTDHTFRQYYLSYYRMRVTLRLELRAQRAAQKLHQKININTNERASSNSNAIDVAAPVVVPIPSFFSTTYHGTIGFFSQELPFSLLIATLLTGFGLWIASLVYISGPEKIAKDSTLPAKTSFDPTLKVVGKITGMGDCKWADPNTETFNGANVLLGRKYVLASGLIEITYDTGAKVILQGPVTYEVETNGGYLAVGKLTGKLEKKVASDINKSIITNPQSLIPNPFCIRTPNAVVTDLGTEFGVEVSKEGTTTSYIYHGSVEVQTLTADGKAKGDVKVLYENQLARVEKDGNKQGSGNRIAVFVAPDKPMSFVRSIPKSSIKIFDLVDVVAGGDGFSGRRNRGIDPISGLPSSVPPKSEDFTIKGDGKYHRVTGLPFVDGVFIPDCSNGAVQVDSAGHAFAWFSKTTNTTAGFIWAGGVIPAEKEYGTLPTELGGIDYASAGHGLLFIHANKGITFDLMAIRRANPGQKLLRFLAVAGNLLPNGGIVDFWVLVDGQSRFQRREVNSSSGAMPITVPLSENQRFLTLVATDSGKGTGIGGDWTMFGDPRLELVSAPATSDAIQQESP